VSYLDLNFFFLWLVILSFQLFIFNSFILNFTIHFTINFHFNLTFISLVLVFALLLFFILLVKYFYHSFNAIAELLFFLIKWFDILDQSSQLFF